jgi:ATP phosphoribosyltransferase regulatory subunit
MDTSLRWYDDDQLHLRCHPEQSEGSLLKKSSLSKDTRVKPEYDTTRRERHPTMSRSRIQELFVAAGYRRIGLPILHRADLFLDLAGEDMRPRLLTTHDIKGQELCLRPEMTIPVCLHHLMHGNLSKRSSYSYIGPVFRHRDGQTGEFFQAGIESFGRDDAVATDAEVLSLALSACEAGGLVKPALSLGDSSLFLTAARHLGLSRTRLRKLRKSLGSRDKVLQTLQYFQSPKPKGSLASHAGILAALESADEEAACAFVEDMLAISDIQKIGGRNMHDIAERYLKQAKQEAEPPLSDHAFDILTQLASMDCAATQMSKALRTLATNENLGLSELLVLFDKRLEALQQRGQSIETIRYKGYMGGRFDYYTGFMFKITHSHEDVQAPDIVTGGRYDRLLSMLGSDKPVQAVGAAIWLDRLPEGHAL